MQNCNCCCNSTFMVALLQQNEKLLCAIANSQCVDIDILAELRTIKSMLAFANPMTVLGERPEIADGWLVYHTGVVFTTMLNNELYVSFRNSGHVYGDEYVYFEDGTPFRHVVALNSVDTYAHANELQSNLLYRATFQGNFIILHTV